MTPTALSKICEIEMGQAPKGSSYTSDGSGYPLIAGAGDLGALTPQPSRSTTAPTKLSTVGDLIICIRATIGDLNWSDKQYCLGRGVAGLRPIESKLDPNYLWRWLEFARSELEKKGRGSTFKQVSKRDIAELEVPLPNSIEEQRRIAAILDKADGIRRKREEALKLADEFLRSAFLEMFGDLELNQRSWQAKPISEILSSEPQNGLYRPSRDYGSGTQILRIDGFYGGYLATHKPLKRLRIDRTTVQKYLLNKDDIVINRVNSREYLGKSALIEELDEETVFESNMMRFSVNKSEVNPRFLVDQMQTQFIKRQILRASKDAVNQSSINQTDVKNFEVRLPPIALQDKYASLVRHKVSNGSRQIEAQSEAEELFASLSQRAFRGEL